MEKTLSENTYITSPTTPPCPSELEQILAQFPNLDPAITKPEETTVAVGLSGGVDSSVTALLLKKLGFKVFGLFMKNWEDEAKEGEDESQCSSAQDFEDVSLVCDALDIPYYTLNFVKEYREEVFEDLLQHLKKGATPNPDVLCNRHIKFGHFLREALKMGADYVATGHYCQKGFDPASQSYQLLKGADPKKDQSYFLNRVSQEALKYILFPIGHLPKTSVRKLAQESELATCKKKDSTGICFIGKRKFKDFMSTFLKPQKGPMVDFDTKEEVGEHDGLYFYTLGQRQGLGLGGPGEPWFVCQKDLGSNTLYVVRGENHPALFQEQALVEELHWIKGVPPVALLKGGDLNLPVKAKIRYRQVDQPCTLKSYNAEKKTLTVAFDEPQRAVTCRQSMVFYSEDELLGGGFLAPLPLNLTPSA